MRVLHVTTGKTWRGGEQQLLYLAAGLARRGIEQRVVCVRGTPTQARAETAGLPVVPMAIRNEIDLFALFRIAKAARRFRPDVMHLHTSQAHGLGAVAARMCGRRRPAVVVTRRVDYSIFRHSFLRLDRIKYHPGADHVLCVSSRIKDVLEQDGLPASMLSVAHSGIDPARFDDVAADRATIRAQWEVPAEAPLIGNVGALTGHKGQRFLIEAMPAVLESVPDAFAVIVGDGKLRHALSSLAKAKGLGRRVVMAGFRSDIAQVLRAFDVFAFPSHMEGLGTSLLDALASRLPVVSTTAGGIPEIIDDGVHGLLVPPKDPTALAAALVRLLQDRELSRQLAHAGRERVEASFSYEHTVEATLAAYTRLRSSTTANG